MITQAPPMMQSGIPSAPLGAPMPHSELAAALIGKPGPSTGGVDYSRAMPDAATLKALYDKANTPDPTKPPAAGGPPNPAYDPNSPAAGIAPSPPPMGLGAQLGFAPGSAPYTTPIPQAPVFGGAS